MESSDEKKGKKVAKFPIFWSSEDAARAANTLREHQKAALIVHALHDAEVAAINGAVDALLNETIVSFSDSKATDALDALWNKNLSFREFLVAEHKSHSAQAAWTSATSEERPSERAQSQVQPSSREQREQIVTKLMDWEDDFERRIDQMPRFEVIPSWSLMVSDDFTNSIRKVDKKLQGRILEAIIKIIHAPMTTVGDTIKPLTGDLKGLWRYRIGDYRLLYDPNVTEHYVTLLSFEERADAY